MKLSVGFCVAVLLVCGVVFGSRLFGGSSTLPVAEPSRQNAVPAAEEAARNPEAPAPVASNAVRPSGQGENPMPSEAERAAFLAGDAAPSDSAAPVASASPSVAPTPSASVTVTTSPARVPSAGEVQAAVRATPVLMFSTGWCPHCKRARAFFQANGISVTDRDIEADPSAAAELQRRTGRKSIPMIDVDGQQLQGFDESVTLQAVASSVERRLGVRGVKVLSSVAN